MYKQDKREYPITKKEIRVIEFLRLIDIDDFIHWMKVNKFQYYFIATDIFGISSLAKFYTLTRINTKEEHEEW